MEKSDGICGKKIKVDTVVSVRCGEKIRKEKRGVSEEKDENEESCKSVLTVKTITRKD